MKYITRVKITHVKISYHIYNTKNDPNKIKKSKNQTNTKEMLNKARSRTEQKFVQTQDSKKKSKNPTNTTKNTTEKKLIKSRNY